MRVVIGTHNALDDELGTLLAEALPDPEMPELDRIGFTLKVDLLIAMRVLWPGARPAWRDFNRLRNTFAHDVKATVTEARAGQLRSTVPDSLWSGEASEPLDVIRLVAAVLWVQMTTRLTAMRDTAAQWRYVNAGAEPNALSLCHLHVVAGRPAAAVWREWRGNIRVGARAAW